MSIDTRGAEGIAPAVYFAHDAGIWRHVSDLFKPEWFQLLMKGNGAGSIQTVEEWGKWLGDSKNYGSYQGQNTGRVVFEKLVSEGHAPNLSGGTLSTSGIDQYVDYVSKTGENIQLKHSIGAHVDPQILTGKYSIANGVDGVGVNSETYQAILNKPGFIESSPGSGIAVNSDTGTTVIDSGMNSDTSRDILLKAQDHARDNLEAFDLTEHLAINALKAAGIAAVLSFAIKGSINLYKCSKGTMRSDDAVDNTVSCSVRAAVTGGVTSFAVGATMAAIGIPTAGLGLAVAIPVGVATGAVVGKTVNTAFDAVYNNLMGGEFITMARKQNDVLNAMFGNLEQHFSIAEAYQAELDRKAAELPDVPWNELESTVFMAKSQLSETQRFLSSRV
ncbi:hypothetical protein PDESU_00667 [Pontiella desulfatans]|uniref:Uncharacterized protein n=1 Tax=Pontiella desulfatans TaxID=2750659 RepID=A0A6C2TX29_PONDE|nr:hypothetical protein [Pontiella desulfatans]VGO12117.1 hypothetical protein PDESU_00667 [Pontiella desulfatans]